MNGITASGSVLVLQTVLCTMLAWSVFCRATRMTGTTRREFRWALAFEGVAAGLLGGSWALPELMPRETEAIGAYFDMPWPAGHTPAAVWLLFLLSIVLVRLATTKYWATGVPAQYQDLGDENRYPPPGERRSLRTIAFCIVGVLAVGLSFTQTAPATAQARQPMVISDVLVLTPGDTVTCMGPQPCVALSKEAYLALYELANGNAPPAPNQVDCRRGVRT